MQQYLSLLKNPPWDAVFFLMLIAVGFFWGISGGKKKMALGALALYALLLLFPYIPLDSLIAGRAPNEVWMFKAGIFLGLLILLSLFLGRSFRGLLGEEGSWWEIIILSILYAGFLVEALVLLAPQDALKNNLLNLSPLIIKMFLNPVFSKWWLILPIFGIMFL